ncbi:MAG: cysteine hydrolase [Desulfuromonadales bacterium]|nr:cysteine hydrolase [Desulfuromonadales bacterium]
METALLLIDLQIDFLSEAGRMPVGSANAEKVIVTANHLIGYYNKRRWLIIDVFSQFKKYDIIGNFFRKHAAAEGSEGGKMDPRILPHGATCFPKSKSSAFSNPYLVEYLKEKEIDHIVLCGVYAEGCVRATALAAQRAGLDVNLISDGTASDRTSKYNWALSHMQKRGVRILSLEEYLKLNATRPT